MHHAAATSDEATTRWVRLDVDTDDTIPVELYSRPYERIDLERPAAPAPAPVPRGLVAALCVAAFACGFGLLVVLVG